MRLLKTHPILGLANSFLVDSPQPANLSYMWNFGSLLGACLIIQILTGVFLAMHYNASVDMAFVSVEHIMRDVNYGWLIRYLHANTASFFFIFVYLHIGRGLYYGSYKSPRVLPWSIGVIILVLMIAIAFLGYVLPYGQMSLWGATVITNLLSAIPWIGTDFVQFVWGGFSVNNATLNRFFSLHYLLPFVLAALAAMHLLTLHEHGSSNPLGVSANTDRLPFHPYFIFKDLVTIFVFLLALSAFVFYMPNVLGHSDNYIPANPMQTPPSIVPEWYLLPYYAILRSIPNKLIGVLGMFCSLLILLAMPILDTSRIRGNQFRPISRLFFWTFVTCFFILMFIGSQHVEDPYITIGAIATVYYFFYFVVIVPVIGLIENTLMDISVKSPYVVRYLLHCRKGIGYQIRDLLEKLKSARSHLTPVKWDAIDYSYIKIWVDNLAKGSPDVFAALVCTCVPLFITNLCNIKVWRGNHNGSIWRRVGSLACSPTVRLLRSIISNLPTYSKYLWIRENKEGTVIYLYVFVNSMNIHTNSIFKFLEACNNVKVQDNTPELCIIIYNMLLHSIPHTSDIVNYLRHCHNNIKAVKYVVWPLSYINVCNFFNVHSSFIIFMLMMDNCYFKKGDMVIRYRTMKKSVTMYSVPYFMSFNIDNYTINHMIFNYYEDTINVNKVRSNKWFIITNGTKNSNSVTITLENRKQVKMLFTQLKQNLFYVMFFIGYAEKFPF